MLPVNGSFTCCGFVSKLHQFKSSIHFSNIKGTFITQFTREFPVNREMNLFDLLFYFKSLSILFVLVTGSVPSASGNKQQF